MKKGLLLVFAVYLVATCASAAFAAVTLKQLGTHPFSQPPMTSEADLRSMVSGHSTDLQKGFDKAGYAELFQVFLAQFPDAKIQSVQIAPGEHLEWMLFRRHGTGPVAVSKDVTWAGDTAFEAYSFTLDMKGQRYLFVVPAACGNLSLHSVGPIPSAEPLASAQPPANRAPTCSMTMSPAAIACGQTVRVDAGGINDADGSIVQVVFQLLDANNAVVAEERDVEAPFIHEFIVPCDSPQYSVKVVAVDNSGAPSNPADCLQNVSLTVRKGGPVVDAGFSRLFDPINYIFARGGYEFPLARNLSAIPYAGGFARIGGDEDIDDVVFIIDALLRYAITEKLFIGGGAGFWFGDDGEFDLIANIGYLLHTTHEGIKTSIFLEGRCEADELISSEASRLGLGLSLQF